MEKIKIGDYIINNQLYFDHDKKIISFYYLDFFKDLYDFDLESFLLKIKKSFELRKKTDSTWLVHRDKFNGLSTQITEDTFLNFKWLQNVYYDEIKFKECEKDEELEKRFTIYIDDYNGFLFPWDTFIPFENYTIKDNLIFKNLSSDLPINTIIGLEEDLSFNYSENFHIEHISSFLKLPLRLFHLDKNDTAFSDSFKKLFNEYPDYTFKIKLTQVEVDPVLWINKKPSILKLKGVL